MGKICITGYSEQTIERLKCPVYLGATFRGFRFWWVQKAIRGVVGARRPTRCMAGCADRIELSGIRKARRMKCVLLVFCLKDYSMESRTTCKLPWIGRRCFPNSLNVKAGNLRRFMNLPMQGQQRQRSDFLLIGHLVSYTTLSRKEGGVR
jgi:hypothetical protein